ncbi:MAG: hypothetical protein PWP37_1385 [Thermotogota bacterium]|nr:hypothetical protein [Thermotogota bacterium]MDK2865193.1 hypothetical protein [Thermotogota bacterium]HCZ06272.1 rubrerythrin family protein [Thermotogota bacterium]
MLLKFQKNEITEYVVYTKLAKMDPNNSEILRKIASDELDHYHRLKNKTGREVKPSGLKVYFYLVLAKLLGITFSLKLMERNEDRAQMAYGISNDELLKEIMEDEKEHEKTLLGLLNEERLEYIGSMVLGLNDALVELTGALAGLTLAIQKTPIVALSGIITGIAAALSMAASDYLARKSESNEKNPLKSALYTGIAYIFTVLILTFPYLIFANPFVALTVTAINAVLVISVFTFFVSVVKNQEFKKNFLEMFIISMGVAAASFFIGLFVKRFFHIEI